MAWLIVSGGVSPKNELPMEVVTSFPTVLFNFFKKNLHLDHIVMGFSSC